MPQTPAERKRAQRARDRARLGDKEYKRIEADKMRKYRVSKRPPKPPKPAQPPPAPAPPAPQPQAVKPNKKSQQKQKAPQQLQRTPLQVVKDFVPLYKSPNATPLSENSISTYLSQFKKVHEIFTKQKFQPNLKINLQSFRTI